MDPLEIVVLDGPEKFTYVSTLLSSKEREHMEGVLLKNMKTGLCLPRVTQIWSESTQYWPPTN